MAAVFEKARFSGLIVLRNRIRDVSFQECKPLFSNLALNIRMAIARGPLSKRIRKFDS